MANWRSAAIPAVLFLTACNRAPQADLIRLVDRFDGAHVEGRPQGTELEPGALWDFSAAPSGGQDPLRGWKAGPGVAALRWENGKLTGRTTSDFPILYAERPKSVDPHDEFDSLDVRIRVSAGANLSATGARGKPDFALAAGIGFFWSFQTPVPGADRVHALTIRARQASRMNWDWLLLRPTDVAGATFEIASIQAVSQRERRASIPSGVGWQGLGDIYHETIVSRSPEKITLEADIPDKARFEVSLGTLEDHPVTFKMAAVSGDREQLLLERTLTTPHRWEPVVADLSDYSGKRRLRLWLEVPDERSIGFWGAPVIRAPGRRPQTARTPAAALGKVEPPQGVVLILADTLRKDHLPMYGYRRDTSPYLARMAAQGALFRDAISAATWTKVATPSLMTSLYPTSHQVHDFTDRLSPAAETLAEVYRRAGYRTVAYSSVLFTGKFTNLHQGFEELHESVSVEEPRYSSKTARAFVDRATGWIERHSDAPFFMFLHVFDPHDPFEPRRPYADLWADPSKKQEHDQRREQIRKKIRDPLLRVFGMPSQEEIELAGVDPAQFVAYDKDWYDGSIRGMDAEIARLLERLRELGLEGKVQVAFVADHGEEFIEHGRMFHGQSVYGELAGVPLLLYRPGVIPAGIEIQETVRSIDLMPTLLDLSGLPVPERAQGRSLVPLMAAAGSVRRAGSGSSVAHAGQAPDWRPLPAVTEKAKTASDGGPPPRGTESYGIVSGGWKLVHNVQRPAGAPEFELYDHAADPLDRVNVAAQHPDVVARLRAELAEWRKAAEAARLPREDATAGMDSKELDRLRSLGYIR
jgi:arylsulfatase A-like enzyme